MLTPLQPGADIEDHGNIKLRKLPETFDPLIDTEKVFRVDGPVIR